MTPEGLGVHALAHVRDAAGQHGSVARGGLERDAHGVALLVEQEQRVSHAQPCPLRGRVELQRDGVSMSAVRALVHDDGEAGEREGPNEKRLVQGWRSFLLVGWGHVVPM